MTQWVNLLFCLLIMTNLVLAGSSRLGFSIKMVAVQGIILGLLPLLVAGSPSLTAIIVSVSAFALKGVVFPVLLMKALREAEIRREVEPYIGYAPSLLIGIVLLVVSLTLGSRLTLPFPPASPLAVPHACFTIAMGLFMIVTRKKALSMVLGYIVLENGIYAFGAAMATEIPLIVEMGVLLDVFVAVFAMGIATHQINREFDHIDVDRLDRLKG